MPVPIPSMTDVERLLSKAARCRRLAEVISDLDASEALLSLARESEAMAADVVAEAREKAKRDLD